MGEAIAGIAESPKDCQPDADFIGPVVIKNSGRRQGRGLFTTEFVKSGTVLLICRALARCLDYSHQLMYAPMSNKLVPNVVNAINKKGDHVRLLFRSLDPSSDNGLKTYCPALPDFAFECLPYLAKKTIRREYENLGTEAILRIVSTIAFDDMSPENINNWKNPDEMRRYYGIWLIPSFINHSCIPNASRINVGDMMSIHATKDINNGEEITIPYFNVLLPSQIRKIACRPWGFICVCERCQLEDSCEKLCSSFLKRVLASGKNSIVNFSEKLDGWLGSVGAALGERNSMWIRSSFFLHYLSRLQHQNLGQCDCLKYEENAYINYMNNLTVVKEALLATSPGDIRRLLLDCSSMATYKKIAAIQPEYEGFYQRIFNIKKSCDAVYGCQKPSIVKILLRKLSNRSFL